MNVVGIVLISSFILFLLLLVVAILNWHSEFHHKVLEWVTFHKLITTLVLFTTLIAVIMYTYETQKLRYEMIRQNCLSLVPLLDFVPPPRKDSKFTVTNKGRGPALNIIMITWMNAKFSICTEQDVGSALPVGGKYTFSNFNEIDSSMLKARLKNASNFIDMIASRRNNLLLLSYNDLSNKRYFTILNGSGTELNQVLEFGEL